MAILRAHRVGGVCVLGSATPSLESEQLARTGKAEKLVLPDRARAAGDAAGRDRRSSPHRRGPDGRQAHLAPASSRPRGDARAREQAILFLNRRGFAPSVRCQACGEMCACPHCSVALTFHKRAGSLLRCHYCEFETNMPAACAKCAAPATELALEGLGHREARGDRWRSRSPRRASRGSIATSPAEARAAR